VGTATLAERPRPRRRGTGARSARPPGLVRHRRPRRDGSRQHPTPEARPVRLDTPTYQGEVHPAYANPRHEVAAVIPTGARRILDGGCSSGALGASLRARGAEVLGIELDPALAAAARDRLDRVVEADIEVLAREGGLAGEVFDCVVFADVL